MTPRRVQIGRDVRLLEQTEEGIDLEGPTRLRPGQLVDLVIPDADGKSSIGRRAEVLTWFVVQLGSGGPMFAGHCSWQ
jgi:hypothetical protein